MSAEKPLHVLVAEKLGCRTRREPGDEFWWCQCQGGKHRGHGRKTLARYDTDWSATGPLIERLEIAVTPVLKEEVDEEGPFVAMRGYDYAGRTKASGATYLLAVCNLILALPDEVVRA